MFFLMAPPPDNQGGASLVSTLIMFGSIILIFYFLIIRPQQKRAKEREKMLSELQKGDKVLTSGGIYGVIDSVDDKTVLLKVADNVKLKFDKQAITVVLEDKDKKNN